jgi:DUF4097 and DUF4098 domain-containing protein YvlB
VLKTFALGLLATVFVVASGCTIDVQGSGGSAATIHEQKRIAVTGTPNLTVRTFDGSIDVRAWDKNEILVDIEKSASRLKDAEDLQVETSQDGEDIRIDAKGPDRRGHLHFGWWSSPTVRLMITVPRELSVDARTGDGAIGVRNIKGHVQLHSGDGSIRLDEVEGDISVTTGDGAVTGRDVQGAVAVNTGDGAVELSGRFETVRARTGDGSIAIDALPGSTMKREWTITTGDGGVRVRLPQAFDAAIHAQTGDGAITTAGVEVLNPQRSEEGDADRHNIRGRIGKGGEMLTVRTGDGSIDVVAR